jgi:hypothetical protein
MVILHMEGERTGNGIIVDWWEIECLIQTIFLLHAGADPSELPTHAPTAVITKKYHHCDIAYLSIDACA